MALGTPLLKHKESYLLTVLLKEMAASGGHIHCHDHEWNRPANTAKVTHTTMCKKGDGVTGAKVCGPVSQWWQVVLSSTCIYLYTIIAIT